MSTKGTSDVGNYCRARPVWGLRVACALLPATCAALGLSLSSLDNSFKALQMALQTEKTVSAKLKGDVAFAVKRLAWQSDSMGQLVAAGVDQEARVRATEAKAAKLASRPLPAAPKGCPSAAFYAGSDAVRAQVLQSWRVE